MIYEFKLPDIGEGVVEGEVVRWLVKEGDQVREDQPLVEVMTDKATVEIPAPRAGKVAQRMYAEGQICPVGKVLVTIELGGSGEGRAAPVEASATAGAATRPAGGAAVPASSGAAGASGVSGAATPAGASVLATPATRKLARELGVDLRQVTGRGRGGRITSDDVRAFVGGEGSDKAAAHGAGPIGARGSAPGGSSSPTVAATPSAPGDVRIPLRGVRKRIAERLVLAKHTAPHATYVEEVDCTELVLVRAKANEKLAATMPGVKLSFLPFVIKATTAALAKVPQVNATLDEAASEIVQRRAHHIGLATATDQGLMVPVIHDATGKSLVQLAKEIDHLAEATRSGKATREELSGSTFTITSLGTLGGLMATAVINFPEVAILGVHKISKRPAVVGDKIVPRDLMNLSITFDHRIIDGYDAARFVAEVKGLLESPGLLMVDLF
ncbi:MAG TPA: dihydrolipoamide acetyltransferase family protein [Polyangia bacterium]